MATPILQTDAGEFSAARVIALFDQVASGTIGGVELSFRVGPNDISAFLIDQMANIQGVVQPRLKIFFDLAKDPATFPVSFLAQPIGAGFGNLVDAIVDGAKVLNDQVKALSDQTTAILDMTEAENTILVPVIKEVQAMAAEAARIAGLLRSGALVTAAQEAFLQALVNWGRPDPTASQMFVFDPLAQTITGNEKMGKEAAATLLKVAPAWKLFVMWWIPAIRQMQVVLSGPVGVKIRQENAAFWDRLRFKAGEVANGILGGLAKIGGAGVRAIEGVAKIPGQIAKSVPLIIAVVGGLGALFLLGQGKRKKSA